MPPLRLGRLKEQGRVKSYATYFNEEEFRREITFTPACPECPHQASYTSETYNVGALRAHLESLEAQ